MFDQHHVTADELSCMPDSKHFQLIDGHLVERSLDVFSSMVVTRLSRALNAYAELHGGTGFAATLGYRCFANSTGDIRRPSLSFIHRGRITPEMLNDEYARIAPDLVVETLGVSSSYTQLEQSIAAFIAAGARLAWMLMPHQAEARVWRADGSFTELSGADPDTFLSGETVLPGLEAKLADLFSWPAWARPL